MRLRLLDLDDQFGGREHLGGARRDPGPGRLVGGVLEADAGPRTGLDDDLVPVMHDFPNTAGGQADAVFVGLHLLRDTDQHGNSTLTAPAASAALTPHPVPGCLPRHSVARA